MRLSSLCAAISFFAAGVLLASMNRMHAQDTPITFDDLQGTFVNATVVYAQSGRRLNDGFNFNNTNTQTIRLRIGPGEEIGQIHTVTVTAPDGRVVGSNSFTGKFALNKPRKGTFGEIIWLFDDSKLVRLQTFETGGRRITVTFKRSGGGLGCAIDAPFAREEGAGPMQTTSAIGSGKVQMLSIKQTSTNCRVEKAP